MHIISMSLLWEEENPDKLRTFYISRASNGGNKRVSLRYKGTDSETIPVKFFVAEVIKI